MKFIYHQVSPSVEEMRLTALPFTQVKILTYSIEWNYPLVDKLFEIYFLYVIICNIHASNIHNFLSIFLIFSFNSCFNFIHEGTHKLKLRSPRLKCKNVRCKNSIYKIIAYIKRHEFFCSVELQEQYTFENNCLSRSYLYLYILTYEL